MPRPTRRGEAICQPKSIPWDKPASGIIPQAPAGVLLWQHAEQMDWHDFLEQLTAADPRYSCSVRNVRDVVKRRVARREAFPQRATPANVNEWAPPPAPTGPSDMDLLGALAGDSEANALIAATKEQFPGGAPFRDEPAYKSDPRIWVRERHVKIETKDYGLVPFEPYEWQDDIMWKFWNGGTYFVEKSRQEGFSSCIQAAAPHALLYSQEVLGTPLMMPIVGNVEDVSLNMLRLAKIVLFHADLSDEERAGLSNVNPEGGAKRIRYVTSRGTSWMQAFPSTGSAGRSYAFNAALLEEFAYNELARKVWESIRPVVRDVPRARIWVISTPNGQSFHADLCDEAEKYDATYLPMNWQIRPERTQAWRDQRTSEQGEDLAAQECDLKRLGAGEQLVNMAAVEAHAAKVAWYGPHPLAGHVYCKALDISGPGQDLDVFTVVDITSIPAQVVYQQDISPAGNDVKLKRVLALHRQWPGKLYIDGTNDATFPELVSNRARHVIAVRFRGAQEDKDAMDHAARLQWRHIERQRMSSSFKNALEFGDLLLHKEHFPKLAEAVKTAQYARKLKGKDDRVEHSHIAKRRGKYPDYWDSAMLAALDVRPGVRRKQRPAPAPRGLRAEGPGQKLREMEGREQSTTTRRGGNWRGRKF